MTGDPIEIHPVGPEVFAEIWPIFQAVVSAGTTYAYPPEWGMAEARAAWHPAEGRTFVARRAGRVLGTYVLKPNQPGRGAHIANAAFMVAPEAQGGGIGLALGEHALRTARADGYLGMQFNLVVATNAPAIRLWRRLGFTEVGRVPSAFRDVLGGFQDALIMFRDLRDLPVEG